jgi:hypothetical protein
VEDAPKAGRVKLPFFIGLTKAGETEPSLAAFAAQGEGLSSVLRRKFARPAPFLPRIALC